MSDKEHCELLIKKISNWWLDTYKKNEQLILLLTDLSFELTYSFNLSTALGDLITAVQNKMLEFTSNLSDIRQAMSTYIDMPAESEERAFAKETIEKVQKDLSEECEQLNCYKKKLKELIAKQRI